MSQFETTFAVWQFLTGLATAVAATFAAITAYIGLSTWREQQRWQQGRGLAVGLLRAANQLKLTAKKVRSDFIFIENARDSLEKQNDLYSSYSNSVEAFLTELREQLDDFEGLAIEAKLLWGKPLDEQVSSFRDVEQTIRVFVISGLGLFSPNSSTLERNQHRSLHTEYHKEIYGRDSIYMKINTVVRDIESVVLAQFPR